jgi:predicted double-glycine peptidase
MSQPFARIRDGAVKVPIPNVQQMEDYTCGAAAFQAVCCYFGVGPSNTDDYVELLKSDPKNGTRPEEIVNWARKFGLMAECAEYMSDAELKAHLDAGRPVICSIQAYGKTPQRIEQYTAKENGHYLDLDGHYIVAIGYDHENFYFEDPSLAGRRGFIPIAEFGARWHEDDSGHKLRLGIVISGPDDDAPAGLREAVYIP